MRSLICGAAWKLSVLCGQGGTFLIITLAGDKRCQVPACLQLPQRAHRELSGAKKLVQFSSEYHIAARKSQAILSASLFSAEQLESEHTESTSIF